MGGDPPRRLAARGDAGLPASAGAAFRDVRAVRGGLPDWRAAGYPAKLAVPQPPGIFPIWSDAIAPRDRERPSQRTVTHRERVGGDAVDLGIVADGD